MKNKARILMLFFILSFCNILKSSTPDSLCKQKYNFFSYEATFGYTPKSNITWISGGNNRTTYRGKIKPLYGVNILYNIMLMNKLNLNLGLGLNHFTHEYVVESTSLPNINSLRFDKYINYNISVLTSYFFTPLAENKKYSLFFRGGILLTAKTTYKGQGYEKNVFNFDGLKFGANTFGATLPITFGSFFNCRSFKLIPSLTYTFMSSKEGGDLYINTYTNTVGYLKFNFGIVY